MSSWPEIKWENFTKLLVLVHSLGVGKKVLSDHERLSYMDLYQIGVLLYPKLLGICSPPSCPMLLNFESTNSWGVSLGTGKSATKQITAYMRQHHANHTKPAHIKPTSIASQEAWEGYCEKKLSDWFCRCWKSEAVILELSIFYQTWSSGCHHCACHRERSIGRCLNTFDRGPVKVLGSMLQNDLRRGSSHSLYYASDKIKYKHAAFLQG